jgi:hypothetical protein
MTKTKVRDVAKDWTLLDDLRLLDEYITYPELDARTDDGVKKVYARWQLFDYAIDALSNTNTLGGIVLEAERIISELVYAGEFRW